MTYPISAIFSVPCFEPFVFSRKRFLIHMANSGSLFSRCWKKFSYRIGKIRVGFGNARKTAVKRDLNIHYNNCSYIIAKKCWRNIRASLENKLRKIKTYTPLFSISRLFSIGFFLLFHIYNWQKYIRFFLLKYDGLLVTGRWPYPYFPKTSSFLVNYFIVATAGSVFFCFMIQK